MPITKSAKKALRQSVRREMENLKKKEAYKKAVRSVKKFASEAKIEDAKKLLPLAYKALDKAAKTHVIKKTKADRLKSRLTKFVGKITSSR